MVDKLVDDDYLVNLLAKIYRKNNKMETSIKTVLLQLLVNFPYHPILWELYKTCQLYYKCKPSISKQETVLKNILNCCLKKTNLERFGFSKILHVPRDCEFMIIMPRYEIVVVLYRNCYYQIPFEWICYFYVQEGAFCLFNQQTILLSTVCFLV